MRNRFLLGICSCLLALAAFGQPKTASKAKAKPKASSCPVASFAPACTLPFDSIKQDGLVIDSKCGDAGCAAADTPGGMQNMAKNNFCATGTAVTVTPDDLKQLQADAETKGVTFGGEADVPTDRSVLQGFTAGDKTVGEGTLVRMAVFIIETHPADVTSGESVNCKNKGALLNDVHMAMGLKYGANECTSVTAEISPHFRPKAWSPVFHVLPKAPKGAAKPAAITKFPLRITGQLFFDASHVPCTGSKPVGSNPKRQSLWEIHPIYAMDVCSKSTLAECSADDDSVWTPLDQWKP
ncbi:MAG: hypothetical protein M3O35_12390 [Acidobacteriota bacterium]|nr:hypothetical protein [Acidobacteriota bacterium]